MKAKFETIDKNLVKIEVEVAPEKFEEGLAYSFKKNAKNFNVKGFRPGKAPRKMVEQVYGEGVLYDDALNYVLPGEYYDAVKELGLEPVDEPKYDILKIGKDELVFTAEVYVKPEVVLGDYKGLEIKNVSADVTDEDIEAELKKVAESNARMVNVEDRTAVLGDTLDIDFKGLLDGEAFEGGTAEGHSLTLGSGQFIPGFEDQLVGAGVGDEINVNVTFPDDYHAEELKGKPVVFEVKVNGIKTRELPEINDDFASDVSEFETLDEYKADLKAKMAEKKATESKQAMENEVIEKATANATIEVPKCMVERKIDTMIERYKNMVAQQVGIPFEQYVSMCGLTIEGMRNDLREGAEKNVRESLVLEAIAKAEDIKATDEQIDAKLAELAEQYKMSLDELKERVTDTDRDYFGDEIAVELTIAFLLDSAVKA
ncbi:MAG: trigger factor [Ruminococcaceae bacterium]|nr:trigger factor [Oscillospiraceae bacterium]